MSAIVGKDLIGSLGPASLLFWRFDTAAVVLWGALWWFVGGAAEINRHVDGAAEWNAHLLFAAGSCAAFCALWQRLNWTMARFAALAVLPLVSALQAARAGRIKAFGVLDAGRWPTAQDIPALGETAEFKGAEVLVWFGLFAPAGTPPAVINKLNGEIGRYIAAPQTNTWLVNNFGGEFAPHTPGEFREFLTGDTARWQKVIKQIGLQLD